MTGLELTAITAPDILYTIFPYLGASDFLRLTSSTVGCLLAQSYIVLIQRHRKPSGPTMKIGPSGTP